MSEPKLISPLLDNFIIGDPISDHNGVRCCPAITKDTNEKYILKIISTPSSQSKLEALLLTGAYKDTESANAYFKSLSDEILREAELLQKLTSLEGFCSYESWQLEPMSPETGYDVYLLRPYQKTLERQIRKNTLTQLNAVNLGIDICSALAICRRSGFLYADLKPSNIFLNADGQYLIGDLGFLSLSSLKYATLPDKYRSAYTAPEIADPFAPISQTIDIYAAGLILHQIYNGGVLPFEGETAPDASFPPPAYADYEMAEIIAKACASNPADRWQTPTDMGQALVSYMQRNGVNNTPIIPTAIHLNETAVETVLEETTTDLETEIGDSLPEEPTPATDVQTDAADSAAPADAEMPTEVTPVAVADPDTDLSFIDEMTSDETAPSIDDADVDYSEISEEVSSILEIADDLIAHDAPEPVIAPEPIDVPMPAPLDQPESDTEECQEIPETEESPVETEVVVEGSAVSAQEDEETAQDKPAEPIKRKEKNSRVLKSILKLSILFLLIASLLIGGIYLYQNVYTQRITALTLDGSEDTLSVLINSDIPDEKLTVICSDVYGNKIPAPVVNGVATFSELTSDKVYSIDVMITGFHQLIGATHATYNTPAQTSISQMSAITGVTDGSVILSFGIEGPDTESWVVRYVASGEEEKALSFSGHMVTVNGLTVGKEYTFTVEPESDLYLTGENTLTYIAQNVVLAENLSIDSCADGKLSASWSAPVDVLVDSWTVRYVCNDGSEESITTDACAVTFEDIDTTLGYTVEVLAAGMSLGQRTSITANSLTITNMTAEMVGNDLQVTWESSVAVDEAGWLLQYTIDGSENKYTVSCNENFASLEDVIPGAEYSFSLETATGNQILNGVTQYTVPEAEHFVGYGGSADRMTFNMCRTPASPYWDRFDLSDSDYTTEFEIGEKASFLVRLRGEYDISYDEIVILYVIYAEDGSFVTCSKDAFAWTNIWNKNYGELDIPVMPDEVGAYTMTIYFNSDFAGQVDFTITG